MRRAPVALCTRAARFSRKCKTRRAKWLPSRRRAAATGEAGVTSSTAGESTTPASRAQTRKQVTQTTSNRATQASTSRDSIRLQVSRPLSLVRELWKSLKTQPQPPLLQEQRPTRRAPPKRKARRQRQARRSPELTALRRPPSQSNRRRRGRGNEAFSLPIANLQPRQNTLYLRTKRRRSIHFRKKWSLCTLGSQMEAFID